MEIYQPAEDSYLFAKFLKNYLSQITSTTDSRPPTTQASSIKMLDMGTGSGILASTASKFLDKKNILAVDINPKAVAQLKQEGFNAIKSDLFNQINQIPNTKYQTPLSKAKFDLITFNAPYLPQDKREPASSQLATTGGKRGDEISIKFLTQAKQHINKKGKIFLLISSLTPIGKIKKFKYKIVAKQNIFMEELLILEFN